MFYHDPVASFLYQKRVVGRILGVADNCTEKLIYIILPNNGCPIIWKSVWAIPQKEFDKDAIKADIIELDLNIKDLLTRKRENNDQVVYEKFPLPPVDLFEGNEADFLDPVEPDEIEKDEENYTPKDNDEYCNAWLLVQRKDGLKPACVARQVRSQDGVPLGNPIKTLHLTLGCTKLRYRMIPLKL